MVNIKISTAENEAENTRNRILDVNRYKRRIGKVMSGNQPFGYTVGIVDGSKRPVIHEIKGKIYRDMISYFSSPVPLEKLLTIVIKNIT